MVYPLIKGHIVTEQPRKGVLGTHVNTFLTVVSDLGYLHLVLNLPFTNQMMTFWPS